MLKGEKLINVEINNMKKLLIVLFMILASSANGQSPCGDDGLCVVQFNAGFN